MKQMIFCDNCRKGIDYDCDEYYDTPQDEEIEEIECPHCKSKLSVSWSMSVDFNTRLKEKGDLE
jgi:DNA-directed RNA polymerase subunit RPC12/RpoP